MQDRAPAAVPGVRGPDLALPPSRAGSLTAPGDPRGHPAAASGRGRRARDLAPGRREDLYSASRPGPGAGRRRPRTASRGDTRADRGVREREDLPPTRAGLTDVSHREHAARAISTPAVA